MRCRGLSRLGGATQIVRDNFHSETLPRISFSTLFVEQKICGAFAPLGGRGARLYVGRGGILFAGQGRRTLPFADA